MDFQEKKLYHQIHPLKLLTDWITGVIALYFLWFHQWMIAFIVMFVPPLIVSLFIMKFANLNKIKSSPFGKYVSMTMTPMMERIRLIGFIIMILGARFHLIWLMVVGLLVVLFGWFRGVFIYEYEN